MYILPIIIFAIVLLVILIKLRVDKVNIIFLFFGYIMVSFLFNWLIVQSDIDSQCIDKEIWSGKVISAIHKEEWDEWIPDKYKTVKDKNSEGKVIGSHKVLVTPAHWEHHPATNYIETSDNGKFKVKTTPDGNRLFDDKWPNTTEELQEYWKIGLPSSSVHIYKNKVQASYSIYKHKEINLEDYKDLPKYPMYVHDYIYIDRIIGSVPNKKEALNKLNKINTELNRLVQDPKDKTKQKSYKEVNIIFVNVGDKPKEYGFALQDKWENGNKNDYIISFSLDKEGNIKWVYPFSWSECSLLDIKVRDLFLDTKQIKDFVPIVNKTATLVEQNFNRKEFAEFEYLQIQPSKGTLIGVWILDIFLLFLAIFCACVYTKK